MTTTDHNSDIAKVVEDSIDPPFLFDELVTVFVGPKQQRFDLYRGHLCQRSDFFKAAFSGKFQEKNGTISLPERDVSIFKYFIHWLYTGKLRGYFYPASISPKISELESRVGKENGYCKWLDDKDELHATLLLAYYHDVNFHYLISLFILADALQVLGLKDQIVTLLAKTYGYITDIGIAGNDPESLFWRRGYARPQWMVAVPTSLNLAFNSLPDTSPMRKLLVVLFCDNVSVTSANDYYAELHPRPLYAVVQTFHERWLALEGRTGWHERGAICKYHEHDMPCTLDEWTRAE